VHQDPTPQDAARLLFADGRSVTDFFLLRTGAQEPWLICRWTADRGMAPFPVDDDALADLCRMVLLQAGVQRFPSVDALRAVITS